MPAGIGLELWQMQIPPSNKTIDNGNGVIFTVPPDVQKMRDCTAIWQRDVAVFFG